jgi:hypothetical protein
VLTARPYRHRERLVDLPGQLTQLAEAAGLVLYERNAALLVGLRGDRLVPRPSFFQLDRVRKARVRGLPLRIIAHEDVLVFRRGGSFAAARERPCRARRALAARGYEPYEEADGTIRLRNCPFDRIAVRHRELACGTNHAMLQALTDRLGGDPPVRATLDPQPGRCCVALRRDS